MRPVLLILKIFGVIVYVGGLTAVVGLWIASNFTSLPLNDPRRALVLDQVGRLMVFLVVPGLILALITGGILLARTPGYIKTCWLKIKLISLVILIPAAHLFCRSRMILLKHATDQAISDQTARQFGWGLTLALFGSIWVVVLGRLKPRFTSSFPPSPTNPATKLSG